MKRQRKILVADLLCGAGGSSTGAEKALKTLGLEMELVCLNHWPTAIKTHELNHPKARHYVQDIATVRPHLIVPEGYLDLLMASPTCTHHSVARGGKPTSDQQRSDPWHIIPWFTELRVKTAIIENVWEFTSWGPVDTRTGKPILSRKGEYFRAWVDTIWKLGATSVEWRKLNAANYGEATTRQRFIMKIRFDGKSMAWAPLTHHKREEGKLDLFPGMKPWRPAREIIDWKLKGKSIFNRKKPLAAKTLARIYAGAVKFNWPEPFKEALRKHMEVAVGLRAAPETSYIREREVAGLVQPRTPEWDAARSADPALITLRNHMAASSVDAPAPTIAANGNHIGLAQPIMLKQNFRRDSVSVDSPAPTIMTEARIGLAEPVIVRTNMHGRLSPGARGVEDPLMTITTDGGIAVAEPVIMNGRKGNQAKSVSTDPVPTLDTKGGVWLAEPFVLSQQNSGSPRSTDEPLPTITTGGAGTGDHPGCARHVLVGPFIATVAHGNDASEKNPNARRANSIDEPLGTIHGDGSAYAVIEPFILNRHGENGGVRAHSVEEPSPTLDCRGAGYLIKPFVLSRHAGGAPRSIEEPTPTQVAKQSHVLISPYYGSGSGETCQSAEAPLPTVTAKSRFGMVVPVTNGGGGPIARSVEDPVPTMTTAKGGEFALVVPVTHEGGHDRVQDPNESPLPTVTGANRGDLAFITAQHGERQGQEPRVHSIDAPTPTIAATGHVDLAHGVVTAAFDGREYDILFRMLEPHELAPAMGMDGYKFAGTKTEQIKQIGNAVSVRMMEAEVGALMADAAPRSKKKPNTTIARAA
ncbi:MAG TPA: DNA cytosine methyltransferase [Rhizomicrobium sp.]|jgi:DNA (cytosine-5)-methyltransferase 1|nr:DNA cytosine methyltransferase [Rhizomicrobium sp.]